MVNQTSPVPPQKPRSSTRLFLASLSPPWNTQLADVWPKLTQLDSYCWKDRLWGESHAGRKLVRMVPSFQCWWQRGKRGLWLLSDSEPSSASWLLPTANPLSPPLFCPFCEYFLILPITPFSWNSFPMPAKNLSSYRHKPDFEEFIVQEAHNRCLDQDTFEWQWIPCSLQLLDLSSYQHPRLVKYQGHAQSPFIPSTVEPSSGNLSCSFTLGEWAHNR